MGRLWSHRQRPWPQAGAVRPLSLHPAEAQALWAPADADWRADGEFVGGSDDEGGGRWNLSPQVPQSWPLAWEDVRFHAANTPFRHLAFFPDMAPPWAWMRERIGEGAGTPNLFGYTESGRGSGWGRGCPDV